MNLLIAAADEPQRGWGGPVALVITCLVFWVFTSAWGRYKETRKTTSRTPSPATPSVTANTVKPQVTATANSGNPHPGPATAVVVRTSPAVAKQRRPIDDFVAQRLGKMSSTQIVREAKQVLNVSDSTVWTAIRAAKQEASQ